MSYNVRAQTDIFTFVCQQQVRLAEYVTTSTA